MSIQTKNRYLKLQQKYKGRSTASLRNSCELKQHRIAQRHGIIAAIGKKKEPITQEILRHVFEYKPRTGEFIWKNPDPRFRKRLLNKPAGEQSNSGQMQLKVRGGRYPYTHMVWLYVYGRYPREGYNIKHVNGVRNDNRLTNLKEVKTKEFRQGILFASNPIMKRKHELKQLREQAQ